MTLVLGSRSPRRSELMEPIVGVDRLLVRPPTDSEEEGFDGLHDEQAIRDRLHQIVRTKMGNVQKQVGNDSSVEHPACCLTADTIVVAQDPQAGTVVLGQPNPDHWQAEVRDWMLRLYSGTTHQVWTGFRIECDDAFREEIVSTEVRFCALSPELVDWYVSTGESVGKAGGYAVQGAAATFVEAIEGSLTNIIGLPVLEVTQALQSLGYNVPVSAG